MAVEGSASDLGETLETHGRLHSLQGVRVLSTGAAVPDQVVTNEDLAKLGYDADWIIRRTGIRQRYHAPAGMGTSDLAYESARQCLDQAGLAATDVDLILVATATPDSSIPSTACHVQRRLNCRAAAMDLNAACSGFVYALVTGVQFLKTGACRHVLVIGADLMSRTVNPADKKTYPLFGDGAGAVLLGAGDPDQGLLAYTLGADGNGAGLLCIPGGGTREPLTSDNLSQGRQYLQMDGRQVFKWAVRLVAESIQDVIQSACLTPPQIDLVLLHQANRRILDAAIEQLSFTTDQAVINVDRMGNTSAASIPLALDEANRAGRLSPGRTVLMCGFGAGLTWGTALLRW